MNDLTASGVLLSAVRRAAAGSVLCAAVVAAARWHRQTQKRIVVGLGGEWSPEQERRRTEEIAAQVADSRLVAALSAWISAPLAALPAAASRRLLAPLLGRDLEARVRVVGCALVIAMLTHTFLLSVFGVPVHAVGWSCRIGVGAAGLVAMWRPAALAAAIKDRNEHR